MEAVRVKIPYTPRPHWKKIHKELETHRFSVLVCHRRFGKTVGVVNHEVKAACLNNIRAPRYAYVAPFRNQAKQIAWSYLKYYTSVIPGVKVNESELFVELPSKHPNSEGARIYVIGADNPDNLRGAYWDGVVLDEFAQIKPELYGEVIRPALADRNGWAIFVGTPKGQNQFYETYKKALTDDRWFVCFHRADESGVLPDAEMEDMRKDMSDAEWRQEMLCDFTASATNVLINIDLVSRACDKKYSQYDTVGSIKVIGVDVARYGDDSSTIFRRQGLVSYDPKQFRDLNNMELASRVAHEIREFSPDAVFVDGGRGEGVIDRLRQLGYTNIIEVNSSGKPDDDRYLNKRVEMWDEMRKWIEDGGSIPNMPALKTELSTPEYKFSRNGKMQLESKDDIKTKIGKSPDLADGLALTFAFRVAPKATRDTNPAQSMCKIEYDPFDF